MTERYLKNLVREANDYGKGFPKGSAGTVHKSSSAKWAKTYAHRYTRRLAKQGETENG